MNMNIYNAIDTGILVPVRPSGLMQTEDQSGRQMDGQSHR